MKLALTKEFCCMHLPFYDQSCIGWVTTVVVGGFVVGRFVTKLKEAIYSHTDDEIDFFCELTKRES